jgi:hypothetical protein
MNDFKYIAVATCLVLAWTGCTTDKASRPSDADEQAEVVAIPGECGQCIAVPQGPREVLFDADVKRAKLYFEDAGNVTKYTAYVDASALPAWVVQIAEEKLGAGEDLEWEIEYYGADKQVYELTRRTEEGVREISVGDDRTVYYLHFVIDPSELPDPVAERVAQFVGLDVEEAARKEYADGSVRYLVLGVLQGEKHRLLLSDSGELLSHTRSVPAVIEVPVHSPE